MNASSIDLFDCTLDQLSSGLPRNHPILQLPVRSSVKEVQALHDLIRPLFEAQLNTLFVSSSGNESQEEAKRNERRKQIYLDNFSEVHFPSLVSRWFARDAVILEPSYNPSSMQTVTALQTRQMARWLTLRRAVPFPDKRVVAKKFQEEEEAKKEEKTDWGPSNAKPSPEERTATMICDSIQTAVEREITVHQRIQSWKHAPFLCLAVSFLLATQSSTAKNRQQTEEDSNAAETEATTPSFSFALPSFVFPVFVAAPICFKCKEKPPTKEVHFRAAPRAPRSRFSRKQHDEVGPLGEAMDQVPPYQGRAPDSHEMVLPYSASSDPVLVCRACWAAHRHAVRGEEGATAPQGQFQSPIAHSSGKTLNFNEHQEEGEPHSSSNPKICRLDDEGWYVVQANLVVDMLRQYGGVAPELVSSSSAARLHRILRLNLIVRLDLSCLGDWRPSIDCTAFTENSIEPKKQKLVLDLPNLAVLDLSGWTGLDLPIYFGKSRTKIRVLTTMLFPTSAPYLERLPQLGTHTFSHLCTIDLSGCSEVTKLPENAFSECHALRRLDLRAMVHLRSIGDSFCHDAPALTTLLLPRVDHELIVGEGFLRKCASLESIDLSTFGVWRFIPKEFLKLCSKLRLLVIPRLDPGGWIEDDCLAQCSQLSEVRSDDEEHISLQAPSSVAHADPQVPPGTTDFTNWARAVSIGFRFMVECHNLKEANLWTFSQLRSIGPEAFRECRSLEIIRFLSPCTKLLFPRQLQAIGAQFGAHCRGLKEVHLTAPPTDITDSTTAISLRHVHEEFLIGCPLLEFIDLTALKNVTHVFFDETALDVATKGDHLVRHRRNYWCASPPAGSGGIDSLAFVSPGEVIDPSSKKVSPTNPHLISATRFAGNRFDKLKRVVLPADGHISLEDWTGCFCPPDSRASVGSRLGPASPPPRPPSKADAGPVVCSKEEPYETRRKRFLRCVQVV